MIKDNTKSNINKILKKNYIVDLQNKKQLFCDICISFKFNMYWDRKEKIQICLGCIKNLTQ